MALKIKKKPLKLCDTNFTPVAWSRTTKIEPLLNTNRKIISSLQFDSYARSLSIDPNSPHFRIVTDGQLPLRQCLHPEACAKDINLPSYYWRFCDLRKEFMRHKAGDLSKALVPVSDATKLNNNNNNLPSLPSVPASIAEMLSGKSP